MSEFNFIFIVSGIVEITRGGKRWDFQYDVKGGMETSGTLNFFFPRMSELHLDEHFCLRMCDFSCTYAI